MYLVRLVQTEPMAMSNTLFTYYYCSLLFNTIKCIRNFKHFLCEGKCKYLGTNGNLMHSSLSLKSSPRCYYVDVLHKPFYFIHCRNMGRLGNACLVSVLSLFQIDRGRASSDIVQWGWKMNAVAIQYLYIANCLFLIFTLRCILLWSALEQIHVGIVPTW